MGGDKTTQRVPIRRDRALLPASRAARLRRARGARRPDGPRESLPGPLAIQVGIWISYIRGGFWGAWAGGWAFILPNFIIVATVAALYVHFGGLPWVTAIFYGVSPAVIAVILHSCYRLTKLGMKDWLEWTLAAVAFAITVAAGRRPVPPRS